MKQRWPRTNNNWAADERGLTRIGNNDFAQNGNMARVAKKITTNKNGGNVKPETSAQGRKLRRISEKIAASGEKLLSRRELERELADRRGGLP